jgi:hypothetical protein
MTIDATAMLVARLAHKGQVDKAGTDYFAGHLTNVASLGRSTLEPRK